MLIQNLGSHLQPPCAPGGSCPASQPRARWQSQCLAGSTADLCKKIHGSPSFSSTWSSVAHGLRAAAELPHPPVAGRGPAAQTPLRRGQAQR